MSYPCCPNNTELWCPLEWTSSLDGLPFWFPGPSKHRVCQRSHYESWFSDANCLIVISILDHFSILKITCFWLSEKLALILQQSQRNVLSRFRSTLETASHIYFNCSGQSLFWIAECMQCMLMFGQEAARRGCQRQTGGPADKTCHAAAKTCGHAKPATSLCPPQQEARGIEKNTPHKTKSTHSQATNARKILIIGKSKNVPTVWCFIGSSWTLFLPRRMCQIWNGQRASWTLWLDFMCHSVRWCCAYHGRKMLEVDCQAEKVLWLWHYPKSLLVSCYYQPQ